MSEKIEMYGETKVDRKLVKCNLKLSKNLVERLAESSL